jgi:hypothetical protein
MPFTDYIEDKIISARFLITAGLLVLYGVGVADSTILGMALAFWFASKSSAAQTAAAAVASEAAEPKTAASNVTVNVTSAQPVAVSEPIVSQA